MRLENDIQLIAFPNQRLTISGYRGNREVSPAQLQAGYTLSVDDWPQPTRNKMAVLCGIIHAEGGFILNKSVPYFCKERGKTRISRQYRVQIAFDDREAEFRQFITTFLHECGIHYNAYKTWFSKNDRRIQGHCVVIDITRKNDVLKLWREYCHYVQVGRNDADFLTGFFEGDGYVNPTRREIVASQNYNGKREVVIKKLKHLGFNPYISHYNYEGQDKWAITVRATEAAHFMRRIGFVSRQKRSRLSAKILSIETHLEYPESIRKLNDAEQAKLNP